jgi:predicted DNA-binding protein
MVRHDRVFSMRMSSAELKKLQMLAATMGLSVAALIRLWIEEKSSEYQDAVEVVTKLRKNIAKPSAP